MSTQTTNYGRIAFEANKDAWPPASQYVPWEHLSDTARQGWTKVAAAVLDAARGEGHVIGD